MPELYFEDFHEGQVRSFGDMLVTTEAIRDFAEEFDPQPFHLDEASAAASPLGGLAASGWHTASMGMRMIYDGFVGRAASLGAPGVEEVRWLVPVRPGDRLHMTARVVATRASRSRPGMGLVTFDFAILTATDVCVMTQATTIMFGCRPVDAP